MRGLSTQKKVNSTIMPNQPSIDQIRRTARAITPGALSAHNLAVELQNNPEALQLAQAISHPQHPDVSADFLPEAKGCGGGRIEPQPWYAR